MLRMIAAMSAYALLTTLTIADGQDKQGGNAKTDAEIMRERAHACEGLKDAALEQCLQNYVGPARDATSASDARPPAAPKQDRRQEAEGAEHDASSPADMTKTQKRAPVGPVKSGPDEKQQ
jgi:hypothetical protein